MSLSISDFSLLPFYKVSTPLKGSEADVLDALRGIALGNLGSGYSGFVNTETGEFRIHRKETAFRNSFELTLTGRVSNGKAVTTIQLNKTVQVFAALFFLFSLMMVILTLSAGDPSTLSTLSTLSTSSTLRGLENEITDPEVLRLLRETQVQPETGPQNLVHYVLLAISYVLPVGFFNQQLNLIKMDLDGILF